jgi:hypothetical protein
MIMTMILKKKKKKKKNGGCLPASQETHLIPCCMLFFGETQALRVDIIQLN